MQTNSNRTTLQATVGSKLTDDDQLTLCRFYIGITTNLNNTFTQTRLQGYKSIYAKILNLEHPSCEAHGH